MQLYNIFYRFNIIIVQHNIFHKYMLNTRDRFYKYSYIPNYLFREYKILTSHFIIKVDS